METAGGCFAGLMSGTSLDGIDGVLVRFDGAGRLLQVLAHAFTEFSPALRAELLALNSAGDNELHRAALAANALAQAYASVVQTLIQQAALDAAAIDAIGAHGQTVRHRPGEFDATGYTVQLNNPALLAELTGIDVVADFRSRDVAAGGQGAPLVPLFHQDVFSQPGETVGVLNIGGMANLSLLHVSGEVTGWDCGPGNALMDYWCQRHTGRPWDEAGHWASSGQIHGALLQALLAEPFFRLSPPKSTGRDLFNPAWLLSRIATFADISPADVQATLMELTALSCAHDLRAHGGLACKTLIVCGGGALNTGLMQRLQASLPGVEVASSSVYGLPPLQVEATAFAWLARKAIRRETGNRPSVTGARSPRVLGAIYPR